MASIELLLYYYKKKQNYCKWNESNFLVFDIVLLICLLIYRYCTVIMWLLLLFRWPCAKSLQSCPAICNSTDCSLPGSSVHRILQARIQEWVVMLSSRASFWLRNGTRVSYIGKRVLYKHHLGSSQYGKSDGKESATPLPMGSQRVRYNWVTNTSIFNFSHSILFFPQNWLSHSSSVYFPYKFWNIFVYAYMGFW